MKRGCYITVGKLLDQYKDIVAETGFASMSLYFAQGKDLFVSYPCQGVEIHANEFKKVVQESIDYVLSERKEIISEDKRKRKYTLKP